MTHSDNSAPAAPTWVFGYGSLIWKTGFDFAESRPAYIRGWARRFWQGSTDHRGVPASPGRVVTLVEAPGEICWGRAYRLHDASRDEVLAHLDHREKGGYERLDLALHFSRTDETDAVIGLVYHALPSNPNYLGESTIELIARQVAGSHGPSGANVEYVLHLETALTEMGAEDAHVSDLAQELRKLLQAG